MSRRRDPDMVRLQQLARAGKRDAARELLTDVLRRKPDHTRAAEELRRLDAGEPLLAERDPAAERRRAQARREWEELGSSPDLTQLSNRRLLSVYLHLTSAAKHPSFCRTEAEKTSLRLLLRNMERERRRRRRPLLLGLSAVAVGCLAVAAGLSGYDYLSQQAERAADVMAAARKSGYVAQERRALSACNTGINRLFCRRVGAEAKLMALRLQVQERAAADFQARLAAVEAGTQHLSEFTLLQRAEAEKVLHDTQDTALQRRWDAACAREADELAQQKADVLAQLTAPLPPAPEMGGMPAVDEAALLNYRRSLAERLEACAAACQAYGLSDDIGREAEERLVESERLLHDLRGYRTLLSLLPSAHSYAQFRKLLGEGKKAPTFAAYAPAAYLQTARSRRIDTAALTEQMQQQRHALSEEQAQYAQRCWLKNGPTFGKELPATPEQAHLMEELFTNRVLHTPLLALTHPEKGTYISEQEPAVQENFITFRRSALDPQKQVSDPAAVRWAEPEKLWKRRIDTRPLVTAAGLSRDTFFEQAHLPTVLTAVLNLKSNTLPAQAKAYVYARLLRLYDGMADEETAGLRFTPTLAEHRESFYALLEQLPVAVESDGVCWLRQGADYDKAERRCADWFAEHAGADYAAELAHNFAATLRVTPAYCGYVNESSAPVWAVEPPADRPIWGQTEGGMVPFIKDAAPDGLLPLSPLFFPQKTS